MSDLQYLVKAVNRANKWANELNETLHKLLVPFIGKKVVRADGILTANVKAVLPVFINTYDESACWSNTEYSIGLRIRLREYSPQRECINHDESIYLGELRDQVLVRVLKPTIRRTDWTVAEVLGKRDAYQKARQALDDCEAALYPFSTR